MIDSTVLSARDCPKQNRVDTVYAGDVVDMSVTLTDPNDCPVDLSQVTEFGTATDPGVDSKLPLPTPPEYDEFGNIKPVAQIGELPPGWTAWYVAKPTYTLNRDLIIFPMEVVDATKGQLKISKPAYFQHRPPNPGIYLSEVVIRDDKCKSRFRAQRWLDLRPTLDYTSVGPITEAEIRMAMRDFGCLNTLLDNQVEFTAEEVFYAIRHPIDIWNDTPPPIHYHTPTTFPYRGYWLIGAVGYLLSAGALSRLRNTMQVQGDNLVIQDHAHGDAYERIGRDYTSRYENWVKTRKVANNLSEGFGTLGSAYAGISRGRGFY